MTDIRHATPSQLAAHMAHVTRQQRMRSARIIEPAPAEPEPAPEPTPAPKPLWFSIVDEAESVERKIMGADVRWAVAEHFNIRVRDIISERRTHDILLPRQIAMFLVKDLTALSFPAIGRVFGGRDHTTVLFAVNKIKNLLLIDADLAATIDTLRQSITGTK